MVDLLLFQDLHMISNVRQSNQIQCYGLCQNKTGQILHYPKGLTVSVLVDDEGCGRLRYLGSPPTGVEPAAMPSRNIVRCKINEFWLRLSNRCSGFGQMR
jgi:hypothetical protein